MRLINADALIEILADMQGRCNTKTALIHNSKIWKQVKNMPTVDAEPVRHGRLIFHRMDEDENGLYECSECHRGETHSPNVVVRYCWNCGARMDGEEEGKKSESNNKGM